MLGKQPVPKVILPSTNTVLILPDSHAHPELDNTRYEALGNWIIENKPTAIINLGDFADMPSLSSYDKGRKSFEGRRYKKDVEVTLDAQEKLFGPTKMWNKRRSKNKKAQYHPITIHTLGNHDCGRIKRVCEMHPELDGTISTSDLKYDEYWDHVVPFKHKVDVNGVLVSHYFTTGVKGSPVGGENPAKILLAKNFMSCMQGHTHYYDHKELSRGDGSKIFGLVGGCFVHPDMVEEWNADTAHIWQNCITILTDLNDGFYSGFSKISQEELLRKYK